MKSRPKHLAGRGRRRRIISRVALPAATIALAAAAAILLLSQCSITAAAAGGGVAYHGGVPASLGDDPAARLHGPYELTDNERAVVERVVAAEAIGEPYEGQKAVAWCIRNTAEARDMRPDAVALEPGQYATPAAEVTQSVMDAVAAVFDRGEALEGVDKPIRFFYAPALVYSALHENTHEYVVTIGGHRFFAA